MWNTAHTTARGSSRAEPHVAALLKVRSWDSATDKSFHLNPISQSSIWVSWVLIWGQNPPARPPPPILPSWPKPHDTESTQQELSWNINFTPRSCVFFLIKYNFGWFIFIFEFHIEQKCQDRKKRHQDLKVPLQTVLSWSQSSSPTVLRFGSKFNS